VAYRADIEIAVKGARQLRELQDQIKTTGIKISVLNDNLNASGRLLSKTFNSVKTVVAEAAKNFDEAALGTSKAVTAAREYYQASKVLNNALRERARLLDDIEKAERGVILANIRASQAARKASGFGAFSADIDVPTQKAIRRNKEKRERIQAAAETAAQIDKLNTSQQEFITRTNAAAQAAARQTAEFYRQARAAKEVAKINAAAGPAQLLLPAATPGSPAMSGGARRRITGQVERLGGARTKDEAEIALRLAENIKQQVRPLSQVEALYAGIATEAAKLQSIKALPSSQMLNATARGLQQIKTGQDKYNAELAESQERLNTLNRLEETRVRRAKKLRDIATYYETGGTSAPISGTGGTGIRVPGGGSRRSGGRRGPGRLANVALGAGFPLLFGGGPGAVLGGAAGGLVGGPAGFAAQIALSAIGTQLDKFAQQAIEMGTAINSTAGALELMREKSLFSSEAVSERAYQLEEQGKVEELAALLTEDLARAVGNEGVRALQDLGAETTETTRLWSLLTAQLNVLIAGPLTSFLQLVNQVLGEITAGQQIASLKKDLAPADLKRLQQRERELGTVKGGRIASELGTESIVLTPEAQQKILKEFGGLRKTIPSIPITQQDRRDITAPKPKKDRAAADAAREAERVAKALIQQRAITLEIQRQSEFSGKIAAAELAKDPVLARRIQEQQELAELGVQTAKQLELEKNSSVQLAIARTAQAKADLIRKKTAQDIAKTEQERQEKFADVLAGLEYQIEYENAVTREKRNQLELDEKARRLKKDGFTPAEIDTLIGFEKTVQKQREPLAKFIADSEKQLKDLQQVAVDVSQGIGNALANSMSQGIVGLIEGTKTAQEIFADFLKSVGDVLIQQGTRMIAMYIAIGIAKAFAGLGEKSGGSETDAEFMKRTANLDLVGDLYKGNVEAPKFADGGFVTGPTSAVVGEGGEPEYIIPASKMRGAMSRYAAGARGSSVIPGSGEQAAGGMGGDTANAAPIDVRYTVERINSVDYVTADQFRAGMAQAAQQGATQGERRALRTLQNSAATRGRIGV